MNPIAGSLPDGQALKAAQVLCLHKPHCTGVVFPEDGWPTSAKTGGFRPPGAARD
jgi:hypothetical protein